MRPKPLPSRGDDLSRPRLDAIIDARHPLVQLAGLIDWARFDAAFGSLYAETGRVVRHNACRAAPTPA